MCALQCVWLTVPIFRSVSYSFRCLGVYTEFITFYKVFSLSNTELKLLVFVFFRLTIMLHLSMEKLATLNI